jgi:thiol-disulfide isomerase/thioredoxin
LVRFTEICCSQVKIIQKTFIIILLTSTFAKAFAQVEALQKAADKVNRCKNFSYSAINTNKDFFSDNLNHETIDACFLINNAILKDVPCYAISYTVLSNTFSGSFKDIYNGKNLILLDYSNNTYRLKTGEQNGYSYQGSVPDILNTAIADLKTGRFKALALADSIVKKVACYHIEVIPADTVKLDSRRDFLISKAGNTLVYSRNRGSGEASKGGMSLGKINIFIENYFSAYKFNNDIPDITAIGVPPGFKTEEPPKPLLNAGEVAPGWELSSAGGKSLSLAKLKGKVVLIDFTGEGCAACMLAIPALNKLQQKYKASDVAVISINIDGTKSSTVALIKKYHISYPVYINGKPTGDAYHVQAIPNFYIIDKQGKISTVHEGFFENFEQQVTAEIEKLR